MKKSFFWGIPILCFLMGACSTTNDANKIAAQKFVESYKTTRKKVKREYKSEKRVNQTREDPNAFSIVLIPDQQGYVNYMLQADSRYKYPVNQRDIYYRQMDYVRDNAYSNGGDFVFAVFLGDFVAHESIYRKEWIWSDEATSKIIGALPYGFVIGNHDYDGVYSRDFWKTMQVSGGYNFFTYFGPRSKYFRNMSWFGGSTANGLNQWSIFEFKNQKILFIGFEMEPSDKILKWAQKIIDAHPGLPTIVATHSYLSCSVEKNNPEQSAYVTSTMCSYAPNNLPVQIWEKFISQNNQIFMVLSGHYFIGDDGEGLRVDSNKFGQPVYSIMTDYQGRNHYLEWKNIDHNLEKIGECGDGWIRILDFDLNTKNIHVTTYNPEFEMYEIDSISDYNLPISWNWGDRTNDNH